MKVLLCASEGTPFIKTGGLADVVGALPKALKANGVDIRVMLPYYKKLKKKISLLIVVMLTLEFLIEMNM